eukprot:gene22263-biopygen10238
MVAPLMRWLHHSCCEARGTAGGEARGEARGGAGRGGAARAHRVRKVRLCIERGWPTRMSHARLMGAMGGG